MGSSFGHTAHTRWNSAQAHPRTGTKITLNAFYTALKHPTCPERLSRRPEHRNPSREPAVSEAGGEGLRAGSARALDARVHKVPRVRSKCVVPAYLIML